MRWNFININILIAYSRQSTLFLQDNLSLQSLEDGSYLLEDGENELEEMEDGMDVEDDVFQEESWKIYSLLDLKRDRVPAWCKSRTLFYMI